MTSLQQYLLLADSTNGEKLLITVIEQALNHPSTFVFGELIAHPKVKQLETSPEAKKHFATLNLLAYGTFSDFQANPNQFIDINSKPTILRKLKLLSLVALGQQFKTLTYNQISQSCGLSLNL